MVLKLKRIKITRHFLSSRLVGLEALQRKIFPSEEITRMRKKSMQSLPNSLISTIVCSTCINVPVNTSTCPTSSILNLVSSRLPPQAAIPSEPPQSAKPTTVQPPLETQTRLPEILPSSRTSCKKAVECNPIARVQLKPITSLPLKGYDQNVCCSYHMDGLGHDTNNC